MNNKFKNGDFILYELGGVVYSGKILKVHRDGTADIEVCLTQKKSEDILKTEMKDVELGNLKLQNLG